MKVLIAGLGNVLLRDDGVGVHAVRRLLRSPPPGALAVEVGTAVLDALHLFEEAERIIALDAVEAGGAPGTIYSLTWGEAEKAGGAVSLHEFGLLSALELMARRPPPEILILGVEPEVIEFGMELSPAVEGALPRLVREVRHRCGREVNGEVKAHA
jgi:hydrogenase maturation protease